MHLLLQQLPGQAARAQFVSSVVKQLGYIEST